MGCLPASGQRPTPFHILDLESSPGRTTTWASELILEWGVEEARPEGPRVGMGFLVRGQPAPPHQLGGLRERCKFPQRGPGRSPGRRRVLLYFEPSDCLSQHLSTCCIQFAWLGISCFLGGIYISISPPHR